MPILQTKAEVGDEVCEGTLYEESDPVVIRLNLSTRGLMSDLTILEATAIHEVIGKLLYLYLENEGGETTH